MPEETKKPTSLLLHAALVLIALNCLFVLWFYISPNISDSRYTKKAFPSYQITAEKGSPFEPLRGTETRKSSRRPPKLEPIVSQIIPEATIPPTGSLD